MDKDLPSDAPVPVHCFLITFNKHDKLCFFEIWESMQIRERIQMEILNVILRGTLHFLLPL